MKKITNINLQNCRAYFDEYKIDLPTGENLIIYGENGSGKSSLFKSFHQFFKSSISPIDFSRNLFNKSKDGHFEVTFSEINDSDGKITASEVFSTSNVGSNNNVPFIKDSSLLNGFLDYTDLLKIYLKSEPNPNLFNLIIINLLREFIPVSTGVSTSLGSQYSFLIKNLIDDARTRKSRCHKIGLNKIDDFDASLRLILKSIFVVVNRYLTKYFDLQDITIEFVLKKINFIYPNNSKSSWYLNSDLRLKVLKNAEELGDHYKDYLNEARLSSVAICLYLASLKLFPNKVEYKLLYLDDIFIGLDTSNRIPIVNILLDEFSDYQIFMSTYDKNFFDVCKKLFISKNKSKFWRPIEIYVGEKEVDKEIIDIPVLLLNNDDLAKARFYLFNNDRPDYPASANYYRKYLESKLKEVFPKELFRDINCEEIDSYKLSKVFALCINFIESFDIPLNELNVLQSYLFILLHPLSHYNTSINTYKRDLKEIDKLIKILFENDDKLAFLKEIKFCSSNTTVQVEFYINKYNVVFYEFYVKQPLFYSLIDKRFSKCPIIGTAFYSTKNNVPQQPKSLSRGTSRIKYLSLDDGYDSITNLILGKYRFFRKPSDIFKLTKVFDGISWKNFELEPKKKNKKK
ncbi:ATP-binding protein [Pedobacter miscanthi]|uniref:Rad50/SbcC-type AAA domain-containing protein n=1 Tax=Pedobacter miscanthi TaxID=2259170 RepID=A0A366LF23_9SPHI|nr:ATP-binding protein [Pedobacter miscanthi]RBQ12079.1 hypothetical protein DRW42_02130 [Pedobacter miscanthi]